MSTPTSSQLPGPVDLSLDCLIKINKDEKGVPLFLTQNGENIPIVIGRANSNQICIDSDNVSRQHAILQNCDNQWQIKDAKSTNGVYINNSPISSKSFYKLVRGDVISLGPPKQSHFKFVLNSHDAISLPKVVFKIPCNISADGVVTNVVLEGQENKTQLDVLKECNKQFQTLVPKKNGDGDIEEVFAKLMKQTPDSVQLVEEFDQKLNNLTEINQKLTKDNAELINQIKILRQKLKDETGNQVKLSQKLEELNKEITSLELSKEEIRSQFLQKNERLLKEKRDTELRAKHDVAEALNAQLAMQKDFESQKLLLSNEKLEAERSLIQQIEDMQKKLDTKDNQADMLKSELCAINMNNEQALFDSHRQIADLMESEFVCSICSELFVNAVTLGCSHTFCEYCINSWERERQGCPICRTVTNYKVRCIIVDSFIDNMIMNFTPDEKTHREELKRTRHP